jgi:hypothetical protein
MNGMNRRDFIRLSANSAVLFGGSLPWIASARTPAPVELAEDPSASEIEELRRRWGFWLDAPAGYSFQREHRLVKKYSYRDYDAELYLQRNGPEAWQWQRVLKVFPKKIEGPLAAVGIPFYHVEAMLGHELDDESAKLERFVEVAQAAQLAKRGYMAITCDLSHQNYVKYATRPHRDYWNRFRDMSFKLAEDWPIWSPHAHRVFVTRLMFDLLEDDPRVDPSRIGITGHSLGGQTCFYAGCLDPRVKVIMASDFAFDFDQSCWDVLHYWGGKLPTVRSSGLENHTLLTLSGAKPFCLLAGFYDDYRSYASMVRAKGYRDHPEDLKFLHHAAGHRPPPWALEEGYAFLDAHLARDAGPARRRSPNVVPAKGVVRNEEDLFRGKLFGRIEKEVLPEAEKRVAAIAATDVMGLPFGAKAKPSAFAEKGALRFDLGMWNGSRFEPFDPEIIFPLDVQLSGFEYPKDAPLGWRNIYVHYTPVTRRIDRIEVHDYFAVSRAPDTAIRELAFGRLASAIAEAYPAEAVETACRYVRYAEQYLVVTSISSRALAAAGRAELEAIGRLTGGGRLI